MRPMQRQKCSINPGQGQYMIENQSPKRTKTWQAVFGSGETRFTISSSIVFKHLLI